MTTLQLSTPNQRPNHLETYTLVLKYSLENLGKNHFRYKTTYKQFFTNAMADVNKPINKNPEG
jgi:hypothetical protein